MKRAKLDHEHYCVIGQHASQRTWGKIDDTILHAQQLLTQENNRQTQEFYVVKVVRVVRRAVLPSTVLTV